MAAILIGDHSKHALEYVKYAKLTDACCRSAGAACCCCTLG